MMSIGRSRGEHTGPTSRRIGYGAPLYTGDQNGATIFGRVEVADGPAGSPEEEVPVRGRPEHDPPRQGALRLAGQVRVLRAGRGGAVRPHGEGEDGGRAGVLRAMTAARFTQSLPAPQALRPSTPRRPRRRVGV